MAEANPFSLLAVSRCTSWTCTLLSGLCSPSLFMSLVDSSCGTRLPPLACFQNGAGSPAVSVKLPRPSPTDREDPTKYFWVLSYDSLGPVLGSVPFPAVQPRRPTDYGPFYYPISWFFLCSSPFFEFVVFPTESSFFLLSPFPRLRSGEELWILFFSSDRC